MENANMEICLGPGKNVEVNKGWKFAFKLRILF